MSLLRKGRIKFAKLVSRQKNLQIFLFVVLISYLAYVNLPSANNNPTEVGLISSLPSDPKDLLKGPPKDSSEEYKKLFLELIVRNASKADTLEISGCRPNPIIIKVENKNTFTVQNNDPETIVLELTQAHGEKRFIYTFPNGRSSLTADFGKGPGAYAYYCNDNTSDAVGIILVI